MWTAALLFFACGEDGPVGPDGGASPSVADADRDGHDRPADCDDEDPGVHPGAEEVPYDGVDQDCAGGDLDDLDEDGWSPPEDCDDADPDANPDEADPFGDAADTDCDGTDGVDDDGDGVASADSGGPDCDDDDPLVGPHVAEVWYDAVDADCDGACDFDQDGDGAVLPGLAVPDGSPCDLDPTPGVPLSYDDCDDTDPLASTTALLSTFPIDGSTTVGVGTTIRANLSVAEPGATLSLADAAGAPVAGASSVDGAQVTFGPAAELAEGAAYTATLDYSCGPFAFGFTTVPRVDAATLVGRVWEADIAGADWTAPAGVGPLVAPFVETTVLVTVVAEAGVTLDLRLAQGSGGVQDLCAETIELPGTPFDGNPSFVVGPTDLPFEVSGIQLELGQATVSGRFAPDGAAILSVTGTGEMDVSSLTPLLGAPACPLLALLGTPCAACADGGGNFCVVGLLEDVPSPEVPGGGVVARSAADVLADPACP